MKTSIPEKRPSPRRKIIAVIGDASCGPDSRAELLARKLGELLIDAGYRIVTGGMGGVMEAVCSGAKLSKNVSSGFIMGRG
jgi:predicted Rossmann-fold nucleotide-binding protein